MKRLFLTGLALLMMLPAGVVYASPDAETLAPDVLLTQTNLSGVIGDIDEDPDSPGADWLTYVANNVDTVCRVSFPTPTGNPTQGVDLQEFKIWVRKQNGTGTPTVSISLYENGVSVAEILAATNVTNSSGELFSATWNSNLLGTADGSVVECYIYGTATGGAPASRCTVEVGAVEWNVEYSAGAVAPTVATQAATDIEATTATGNGNITNTGGENCDIRGIVWDLATHGDPGNTAPGASDYANDVSESNGFGTGAFTRSLTGLPTGDTIYARAYAHNSAGYAYGDEVNFLTKPAAPTSVSATDGDHTDKVTITWTKSTGANDYQVYRDGNALGWLGDVATGDDTGADAPTITPCTASASDGDYVAYVTLSLAGESANNGTMHTYKVRAKNTTGESADSSTDNGYRDVGVLTLQWQRSTGDSDADYSNIDGATTDPYNDTGAPENGDGRYFQCVLDATGAAQQTSTANRGYRGTLSTPSVTTGNATSIEETTATLNGEITATGGDNATDRGFQWDIDTGVPYADNWTEAGNFGVGVFNHGIAGLNKGELYYYIAGANNTQGWGWGSEVTFLTKPDEPTGLGELSFTNNSIFMDWTLGEGSQKTMLRYRTDQYPADPVDGTQAYFDAADSCNVTSLSSGQIYYFRAWSYATEGGREQYSDITDTDTAYTLPGNPSNLDAHDPCGNTIDLDWTKGAGGDKTMVRRQEGSFPTHYLDGDEAYFDTDNTTTDTGLSVSITYFYRAWAYDSDSSYYSSGYTSDNETTTESSQMPPAPTNFTLVDLGGITISANWTASANTSSYLLLVNRDANPDSTTGFETAYSGNATLTSANLTGYALGTQEFFFSLWAWNESGYSENYTTASIGSAIDLSNYITEEDMEIVAEQLENYIELLSSWESFIEMAFCLVVVIALCGLAYWHRDKYLYLVAGAGCLLFGLGFWGTATYLSLLVVVLGIYNFFKMAEGRKA